MAGSFRVLELYCGIGGCAAALPPGAVVTAAIDISLPALAVYRRNFGHAAFSREIASLTDEDLARWAADLWWLSPPCQPYSRLGAKRDLDDTRAASFPRVLKALVEHRPRHVALENVIGFETSRAAEALRQALSAGGYRWQERALCPSELGWPNRRPRYYFAASRGESLPWRGPAPRPTPLAALVEAPEPPPESPLWVPAEVLARYAGKLDIVDPRDAGAAASCFTSGYGRLRLKSGSLLRTARGPRWFSPAEILRLLDFPPHFTLPPELSLAAGWRLAGNSLSLPAARRVLEAFPELETARPGDSPADPRWISAPVA